VLRSIINVCTFVPTKRSNNAALGKTKIMTQKTGLTHRSGWSELVYENGKAFFQNHSQSGEGWNGQSFIPCDGVEKNKDGTVTFAGTNLHPIETRDVQNVHWVGKQTIIRIPDSYFVELASEDVEVF